MVKPDCFSFTVFFCYADFYTAIKKMFIFVKNRVKCVCIQKI